MIIIQLVKELIEFLNLKKRFGSCSAGYNCSHLIYYDVRMFIMLICYDDVKLTNGLSALNYTPVSIPLIKFCLI